MTVALDILDRNSHRAHEAYFLHAHGCRFCCNAHRGIYCDDGFSLVKRWLKAENDLLTARGIAMEAEGSKGA